jgi:hypothetical protein
MEKYWQNTYIYVLTRKYTRKCPRSRNHKLVQDHGPGAILEVVVLKRLRILCRQRLGFPLEIHRISGFHVEIHGNSGIAS